MTIIMISVMKMSCPDTARCERARRVARPQKVKTPVCLWQASLLNLYTLAKFKISMAQRLKIRLKCKNQGESTSPITTKNLSRWLRENMTAWASKYWPAVSAMRPIANSATSKTILGHICRRRYTNVTVVAKVLHGSATKIVMSRRWPAKRSLVSPTHSRLGKEKNISSKSRNHRMLRNDN